MTEQEELDAGECLRQSGDKEELAEVWWRLCDDATGEQRNRLQAIYKQRLMDFAPMMRDG